MKIEEMIEKFMPKLSEKLKAAEMKVSTLSFIHQCLLEAAIITVFSFFLAFILVINGLPWPLLLTPILVFPVVLFLLLRAPEIRIKKRREAIDGDILFAGRHILLGLKGGLPLFQAMASASKGYGEASREIKKVIQRVMLGTPTSIALRDVAKSTPSPNMQKLLMQIANSMGSGGDVVKGLEATLDQIAKEQLMDIKLYGQKLGVYSLLYLTAGIVFPSLILVLLYILSMFANINFDLRFLMAYTFLIAVIHYMFVKLIESSRPNFMVIE